eukprot:3269398-Pyramimonas_sp.AAC.2
MAGGEPAARPAGGRGDHSWRAGEGGGAGGGADTFGHVERRQRARGQPRGGLPAIGGGALRGAAAFSFRFRASDWSVVRIYPCFLRLRLVRRENRSALPASDWSVVRTDPHFLRPIGPS